MKAGRLRQAVGGACARAARRAGADLWPLTQLTAAATAAWWIARWLGSTDPFFAPTAAIAALNTMRGDRGANAARLLGGVLLGIAVGEFSLLFLKGGYGTLALALFAATVLAVALGGNRLVVGQASSGAVLTAALGQDDVGMKRISDALIGAGVALVFSQLLFAPEPVALIRRGEKAALETMAEGLDLAAESLEVNDDRIGKKALSVLRDLSDRATDLGRMGKAGVSVARYSLLWQYRATPSVKAKENAAHLDSLCVSCLMLARVALSADPDTREALAPGVRVVSCILQDLAADPGDRETRQNVVERILRAVSDLTGTGIEAEAPGRDAAASLRLVATDLLIFVGASPDEAASAVRRGSGELSVPRAPSPHWPPPFVRRRFRWPRR